MRQYDSVTRSRQYPRHDPGLPQLVNRCDVTLKIIFHFSAIFNDYNLSCIAEMLGTSDWPLLSDELKFEQHEHQKFVDGANNPSSCAMLMLQAFRWEKHYWESSRLASILKELNNCCHCWYYYYWICFVRLREREDEGTPGHVQELLDALNAIGRDDIVEEQPTGILEP